MGRVKETRAPPVAAPSAQMRPPWASTRPRAIARPRPVPPLRAGSLRQKRSNMRRGGLGGEAAAGVLDADGDVIVVGVEPDGDRAVGGGVLQGVGEQVEENALDLVGRAADGWRFGELLVEGDAACSGLGFDTADAGIDEWGDGDDLELV